MSLSETDGESEQNEIRNLQMQLESTNQIVHTLSKQLTELREQVIFLRSGNKNNLS